MATGHLPLDQHASGDQESESLLGYPRGVILSDDLAEYRVTRNAESVLLERYSQFGIEGIHNLMGLVDNCRVPSFFSGQAYEERFLAVKLMEERLSALARKHLGGDSSFRAAAFNRVSAGVTSLVLALVPRGSLVIYVVPPYPGLVAHGHPCTPRAVEIAQGRCKTVTTPEEVREILNQNNDVALVVVCASYRGIVRDEILSQVCRAGRSRGVPVFVDDASGARFRVVSMGQSRAIDLGADLVFTSCDKAGLFGPRAGLLLGKDELMLRIGAKAAILGADARPTVIAAIVRCLEEYDADVCKESFAKWGARHEHIRQILEPTLGKNVGYDGYNGVYMGLEAFADAVKRKSGDKQPRVAPIDLSTAHSMLMLRRHGFMTIAALHCSGASKLMNVKVNTLRSPRPSDEDISAGILDAFNELAKIASDKSAIERVLFETPKQ